MPYIQTLLNNVFFSNPQIPNEDTFTDSTSVYAKPCQISKMELLANIVPQKPTSYMFDRIQTEIPYYKFIEVITNSHMTNTCFNILLIDNMFRACLLKGKFPIINS